MGPREEELVTIGELGYGRSTGVIQIEMTALNNAKYVGLRSLEMFGDLDLAWRS